MFVVLWINLRGGHYVCVLEYMYLGYVNTKYRCFIYIHTACILLQDDERGLH